MSREEHVLVSVVVCAYNEEKLLRDCLEGLVAQTYPQEGYEVLVIDDESTDNTFDIALHFIQGLPEDAPEIRLVRIRHGGLSVARNSGIQLSGGRIIAFIDGDAVAEPTWLAELVRPFEAGADYVGCRINLLNSESWLARFLQHTRHRQFFGPRIFNDQCIGCNMAFDRAVFDEVGGFHENFVSRGDESSLQERIRGRFRYAAAPDATVLHERPDRISTALRITWKTATLSHLSTRATGRKKYWKAQLLFVEQSLMALFPIVLVGFWFNPGLFVLPLAVAALAVFRRLYVRPLNRAIATGLIGEYGIVRGTVGHILFGFAYNVLTLVGEIVGLWRHRREVIRPPMTTEVSVVESATSRAG